MNLHTFFRSTRVVQFVAVMVALLIAPVSPTRADQNQDVDTTPPTINGPAVDLNGSVSGQWATALPHFVWPAATDSSGLWEYEWSLSTDPNNTYPAVVCLCEAGPNYSPIPPMEDGIYYLRVRARDASPQHNISDFVTLYVFKLDRSAPTLTGLATDANGSQNNVPQDTVSAPSFTWPAAWDANGIAMYAAYWGPDPNGQPSTPLVGPAFTPPSLSGFSTNSTMYLRVMAFDNASRPSEVVTMYTFQYWPQPVMNVFLPFLHKNR